MSLEFPMIASSEFYRKKLRLKASNLEVLFHDN